MADDAGTAAAASGTEGATAQPTGFQAPPEWSEVETYKPFFVEKDGSKTFDVHGLAKTYADTVTKIPVVPAKAEDYSFEFDKDLPVDEAAFKLAKEAAKNLGLTQAQFEGMQKHAVSEYARVAGELASKRESAKAELVKEWGGPQKFKANLEMARKAAKTFFGNALENHPLADDPGIAKGLYTIATKLSEDTLKSGSGAGADSRSAAERLYGKTTPGPQQR